MTRIPTDAVLASTLDVPTWTLRDPKWASPLTDAQPRVRLFIDNDFAGDPDDLFQIVHHLLSPSVDIRGIICSRAKPEDDGRPTSAHDSLLVMRDVFRRMGLTDSELLLLGAEEPLIDGTPATSAGVDAILAEVRRDDDRPIYYAAGGGLTELASAYLKDRSIADRITLVWIGGLQHDEIVGSRGVYIQEYNRDIDLQAAQIVFSAGFQIWQVPRDQYRRCIMPASEIRQRVGQEGGALGRYLRDEILHVLHQLAPAIGPAEMYPMGDQPLVLLTVLQGVVDQEDDFSSNQFATVSTPAIDDDGRYVPRSDARAMRVYTHLDHRLMFEDFYAKLREFAEWQLAPNRQ